MNDTVYYQVTQRLEARRIAELYRLSAEGYTDYTWSLFSQSGENLLDVDEVRISRKDTEFSYQNCFTAREGKNVIGMLHSYPIYSLQKNATHEPMTVTDSIFMPFKDLEESMVFRWPKQRTPVA